MRLILTAIVAAAACFATDAPYDKLANELVAPCCWKEALAQHRSPAADEARAEFRTLVAEGRSEAEIRDWFVAKYGERILLTPAGGKARALFWIPIAGAAFALSMAVFALRRWSAKRSRSAGLAPAIAVVDDSEWDW